VFGAAGGRGWQAARPVDPDDYLAVFLDGGIRINSTVRKTEACSSGPWIVSLMGVSRVALFHPELDQFGFTQADDPLTVYRD